MVFHVYESCRIVRCIEIEAENEEDAVSLWKQGEGDIIDSDCGDVEDFKMLEVVNAEDN